MNLTLTTDPGLPLSPAAKPVVASEPPSRSPSPVWQAIEPLATALMAKEHVKQHGLDSDIKASLEAMRQHLARASELLNWHHLAANEVAAGLRRNLGLTALAMTPARWGALYFAWVVVLTLAGAAWIGLLVAGALCLASASGLRRYRIRSLRPHLRFRLLHLERYDEGAAFPLVYHCLVLDPKTLGPKAVLQEYAYAGVSQGQPVLAIGIFSEQGKALAFLALDAEPACPLVVLGQCVSSVPASILSPGLQAYLTRERELLDRLAALEVEADQASAGFDLARFQEAWRTVVLPPAVLEPLLRAALLFAFRQPAAPRGLLLKGAPGTGKSLVARTLAESLGRHAFKLSVGNLKGENLGESANNVRRLWADARAAAPALILVDECEGAFAKRGSDAGDAYTSELVQTFLAEWDGIGEAAEVLVVAATNRPDLLDDAIMSRFSDVIELQPVGHEQREALVDAIANQLGVAGSFPRDALGALSGLSGREIRHLLQLAVRLAAPEPPTAAHVDAALASSRGKQGTRIDPAASWDTLVLPETVKARLRVISHMLADAETLEASGIPVPRTLLLFGPPGTGKTQIARTLANEAKLAFQSRSTTELKGQYLGQAAARVAQAFETARASSPSILFLDEIDALTGVRDSGADDHLQAEALTQLLQELDGIEKKIGRVFVIAATNRPECIDPAILSRFGQKLEVALPEARERAGILRTLLSGRPVAPEVTAEALAARSAGLSGRDLRELITEAFAQAVGRCVLTHRPVADARLSLEDVDTVLARFDPESPSVCP